MKRLIYTLFAILIFFIPIVLWPYTSEVFEFNKMVLVYILTILIFATWIIRSIVERKFIFRRTILDTPLLIFFGSQLISTLVSIDFYTSVFGYYSRFNGGLLSTICYLILYWAYVSNFDVKDTIKLIKFWLASAAIVSIYGVMEHFGIDKNIWVQDVQSRVFSSLGQPNWLAAWLVALTPLTWSFALNENLKTNIEKLNLKSLNFWVYFSLSVLFFWTLVFTKSRSGMLGMGVAFVIFWSAYFWQKRKMFKEFILPFAIISSSLLIISLISGNQIIPSLNSILSKSANTQVAAPVTGTALESGGTESGVIRKIVWNGAIQIWQHYPILGTGVETFAFSYYLHRPIEHNLTSEWDFIYNKAHNEFLNFMANSGTVGIISYLVLIGFIIYSFIKFKTNNLSDLSYGSDLLIISYSLLAGFVSLSVSNFFGFSVVPTQLQFFLFPAFAVASSMEFVARKGENKKIQPGQKVLIVCVLLATGYLLLATYRYWYSDVLYARGKNFNTLSRPDLAVPILNMAIKYEPSQALYYGEIANSFSTLAMAYSQAKNTTEAGQFASLALNNIQKGVILAPANINLRRTMFGIYVRLSTIDEKYLAIARDLLAETIKLAPTDPKLIFNLGVADANLGQYEKAATDFQKTIELKANYNEARIQYAALLVHLNRGKEAKEQLLYVLTQDPNNTTVKQALENLK